MLQLFLVAERCSDKLAAGKKVLCVEFSKLNSKFFRLALAANLDQLS